MAKTIKSKKLPNTKNSNGKVKAIEVSDPNDKRLRAYNDSATIHKVSVSNAKSLLKGEDIKSKNKNFDSAFNRLKKLNKNNSPQVFYGEVRQKLADGSTLEAPVYKKPVQPYVYKKPVSSKVKTKTISKPKQISNPAPKIESSPKQISNPAPKIESSPKQPQKPNVREEKSFYQGRRFMDSTGLRPGLYTRAEVMSAINKKKNVKK